MKAFKVLLLAAVLATSFTSCVVMPHGGIGPGGIYTNITEPLALGPNTGSGQLKRGEASATNILGIISIGDYSIGTAAANGGIRSIKSVDVNITSILFIFGKTTTIVYGE